MALGRSIERALAVVLQALTGFVVFFLAHYFTTDFNIGIVKIISVLEIVDFYRSNIYLMLDAVGIYFEINVVF